MSLVADRSLSSAEGCAELFIRLVAGCVPGEGERGTPCRQAITPARYDEGTRATHHNAAAG